MFSEAKVIKIYCMADDFCNEFAIQQEKYMVEDTFHKQRNNPGRMSNSKGFPNVKSVPRDGSSDLNCI